MTVLGPKSRSVDRVDVGDWSWRKPVQRWGMSKSHTVVVHRSSNMKNEFCAGSRKPPDGNRDVVDRLCPMDRNNRTVTFVPFKKIPGDVFICGSNRRDFLVDRLRRRQTKRRLHRRGYVVNDRPIISGPTRSWSDLVELLDTPFEVGDCSRFLSEACRRKDHICAPVGVMKEHVNRNYVFGSLKS